MAEYLGRLTSDKKRMMYLAEATAELTGLSEFPQYLTLLFEIDGLVLNDDRHLNNIAVIRSPEGFRYCPIFDQGAGLLSNVMYGAMDIAPAALIASAKARPFHTTFNRQVKTTEDLYGKQLSPCDSRQLPKTRPPKQRLHRCELPGGRLNPSTLQASC